MAYLYGSTESNYWCVRFHDQQVTQAGAPYDFFPHLSFRFGIIIVRNKVQEAKVLA